ncbi:hypothetical protein BH10PSE2_BH10PSE2_03940 [soil metagenome]
MTKPGKTIHSRAPAYRVRVTPRWRRRPPRPEKPLGMLGELLTVTIGLLLAALVGLFVAIRLSSFGVPFSACYVVVLSMMSSGACCVVRRRSARGACVLGWAILVALGVWGS